METANVQLRLDKELLVKPSNIYHEGLGTSARAGYSVITSNRLVTTPDMNYEQQKELIHSNFPGIRHSTLAEEITELLKLQKSSIYPKYSNFFADLFSSDNAFLITSTAYRVPKGWDSRGYKLIKGRKYYIREKFEDNEVVGVLRLPEGRGRIIVEFNDDGDPVATDDIPGPHEPYTAHFMLALTEEQVAVELTGDWFLKRDGCLNFLAFYTRSSSKSFTSFRPVQGSLVLPKFEYERINAEELNKFLEAVKSEAESLPAYLFQAKHGLQKDHEE